MSIFPSKISLEISPKVFFTYFCSISNSFLDTTLDVLSILPSFFSLTGIVVDFSPSFKLLSIILITFISANTSPFILKCSLIFCSTSSSVMFLLFLTLSNLGSVKPKYNTPAGITSFSTHTASKYVINCNCKPANTSFKFISFADDL